MAVKTDFRADAGEPVNWNRKIIDLIGIRPPELQQEFHDVPAFDAIFQEVISKQKSTIVAGENENFWARRLKSMTDRFGAAATPNTTPATPAHAATVFCQNFIHVKFSAPLLHTSNCPVAALGKIPGHFIFAMAISPASALLSLPRSTELQLFAAMPDASRAAFINFFTLAAASVAFDGGMDGLTFIRAHLGWTRAIGATEDSGRSFIEEHVARILLGEPVRKSATSPPAIARAKDDIRENFFPVQVLI
ncbi:MAG: hypothetical protein ABI905_05805 [Betaproteobacteria bacterium]